jgi:MFS transporter, DHA1 family, multidrug resistance protein
MTAWKKNLIFIWFSQFVGTTGFSLCLPFAPFYIQQLGVTDPSQAKVWASLSASATALGLAIMAPVWGMLSDRYGRRMMLLRSQILAAFILAGMGLAPSVQFFIIFRFLQGAFTGTINATTTLVAVTTPEQKQGFALGAISAAQFTGFMTGPFVGGFLADSIGFRPTFFLGAALLLSAAILVFLNVKEHFVRPPADHRPRTSRVRAQFKLLLPLLPVMGLLFLSSMGRTFDSQLLPLYVQDIRGRLEGAARWTGAIHGVGALGAALSGFIIGRLADATSPKTIGKISALIAATAMLFTGFVSSLPPLFPLRFMLAFSSAGLDPVLQSWLSRATPPEKRGAVLGLASTVRSLGWGAAPLASGGIAVHYGFTTVYFVGCIVFILLATLMHVVGARVMAFSKAAAAQTRDHSPACARAAAKNIEQSKRDNQ